MIHFFLRPIPNEIAKQILTAETGNQRLSHSLWRARVGIVLPTDPVLLSLQTIVGLSEATHDHGENSGNVRLIARPGAVSLDRVVQQYARVTTGIGTDQLWAALRQWGAATLTGREGL
ncbi:MAG: hypothetical protein HGB05_17180 [Chloroflexi bacterium]|nr:hypothetical protein [Chloroflexota bacterium]